jgi:citrate synthase
MTSSKAKRIGRPTQIYTGPTERPVPKNRHEAAS